uniref:Domain of unknown function DX domain-containing protein n=1 Tax=Caenorhabditis japonica TaxID=281687 RepID=A0A8R1ETC5_CAEJA
MLSKFIFLLTIGLVYSRSFGYLQDCTKDEDCFGRLSFCSDGFCFGEAFPHHFNSAPLTCRSDDDCAGQKNHLCVRGFCEDFSKTSGHFTIEWPCDSNFDCFDLPNHSCIGNVCKRTGTKIEFFKF